MKISFILGDPLPDNAKWEKGQETLYKVKRLGTRDKGKGTGTKPQEARDVGKEKQLLEKHMQTKKKIKFVTWLTNKGSYDEWRYQFLSPHHFVYKPG